MKKFQNMSIRNKILVYFALLILLVIALVLFPIYIRIYSLLRSSTESQALDSVTQAGIALDNTLDNFNYMADFIAYSSDVQTSFEDRLDNPYIYEDIPARYFATMERLMIINYSSNVLNRIDLFGDNGMIFETPNRKCSYTEEEITCARKIAHAEEGRSTWNYFRPQEYTLFKEIRSITSTKELGFLLLSVKQSYLNSNLDSSFSSGKGSIIVLDQEGNFICGQERNSSLYQILQKTDFSSEPFSQIQYENSNLLVTSQTLTSKGLTLYGVVPESALYHEVHTLFGWIIAIIAGMLLVILYFAMIFANSFSRPLRQLTQAMDVASEGDFTHRLPEQGNDEVGQLSQHFNTMTAKINDLIDNVYKQKLLQKEAEYQMLQAQINPHFIYNVLDSICWTARSHSMYDIADMVSALSKLLRISISKRTHITLREEISCIQYYLQIQKIRYKDRLNTIIDIDPMLNDLVIPKLILEPLVENAVVHGLEQKDGIGLVMLSGKIQNDLAVFTIIDNGVGISEDRIQDIINEQIRTESTHTGLGLMTVHKRIQHIYGLEYGIEIHSQVGSGTKIYVRFPNYSSNS